MDQSRQYGIQHNISAKFEEVGILFNDERLIAALEEMAYTIVVPVILLSIHAVEVAHPAG